MKIRPEEEHKYNSPWNVASEFPVDMSFSVKDIGCMLEEYEVDQKTGMQREEIAELLDDMRKKIADYPELRGQQYVIEMKIWHGEEYNKRGREQLSAYLDYYQVKEGYLLSFNFNKKKTTAKEHSEPVRDVAYYMETMTDEELDRLELVSDSAKADSEGINLVAADSEEGGFRLGKIEMKKGRYELD